MTENRRIFLNIIATYGRSLYALIVGIFTSRWVLMSLGQTDYGLYGVVGGLAAFIAFFNNLLSGAISRFYAVSIGQAKVAATYEAGLEECRKWFSTGVLIHATVPAVLIAVGYPLGVWAIKNWLTIPPDRVHACVWVFRFVCAACFVGMVSVPFQAMYTAKQYIAELTIYSFVTTTLNVAFLYFMVNHQRDWLAIYAFWACLLSVVPQLIICVRATVIFKECRLRLKYCLDFSRLGQVVRYAWWQTFGCLGAVLRSQGIAILVNKYFGPKVNAAMTVANTVNSHTNMLSAAMIGAFSPVIITAYGAGDMNRMRQMAYRACKFGMVLSLLFVIPLSVEIDFIMRLWLKEPPVYAAGLCLCMMAMLIIDKSAIGHMIAVNASGKIALYQAMLGGTLLFTLPLAWLFVELGFGVYSIGWALMITMIACALGRVWFARSIVGLSARYWTFRVVLPVLLTTCVSGAGAYCIRLLMAESVLRVLITTIVYACVFMPMIWFVVFDAAEREFVYVRVCSICNRALGSRNGGPHA